MVERPTERVPGGEEGSVRNGASAMRTMAATGCFLVSQSHRDINLALTVGEGRKQHNPTRLRWTVARQYRYFGNNPASPKTHLPPPLFIPAKLLLYMARIELQREGGSQPNKNS